MNKHIVLLLLHLALAFVLAMLSAVYVYIPTAEWFNHHFFRGEVFDSKTVAHTFVIPFSVLTGGLPIGLFYWLLHKLRARKTSQK